jgi:hypothetical protein
MYQNRFFKKPKEEVRRAEFFPNPRNASTTGPLRGIGSLSFYEDELSIILREAREEHADGF